MLKAFAETLRWISDLFSDNTLRLTLGVAQLILFALVIYWLLNR